MATQANSFACQVYSIAVAGALGSKLGGNTTTGPIGAKKKRMAIITANGLLILIPSALYLHSMASSGDFGSMLYLIQALELTAGATNLFLMSLNIRDGLKLTGRFNKARKLSTPR